MFRRAAVCLCCAAVSLAAGTTWGQQRSSPDYVNPGPAGQSMGPSSGLSGSGASPGSGAANNGAAGGSSNAARNANETQIEGELVDAYSAAKALGTRSGLSGSVTTPDMRVQGSIPSTRQPAAPPPANVAGANSSGSADMSPPSNHVGDSAGTYNRPGAVGGSGDNSAAIAGTGRMQNDNQPSSIAGGAATNAPRASGATAVTPADVNAAATTISASIDTIRANLKAGTPAAIVSGGKIYVLAIDPRQLADNAGQIVRIDGQVAGTNIILPDQMEARAGSSGAFHALAFTKPGQENGNTRTAGER